ncbi:nuclear transport factor 2 family protein [Microbacterium sp. KR10-403]|uniref:nuclear transport factor 2 family protein n=1 Tax=Microbacterium sp. KR10-403 TaxID=3158581 RepID=UPI0032E45827
MDAFRSAAEAGDIEAIAATLADDVVFRSPVAHKPYRGRDVTKTLLGAVIQVFEEFRYARVISDGADHALVFETRVGDRAITGCDFIHVNEEGLIDELMVMVRPLSGLRALAEAMGARSEVVAVNRPAVGS